MYVIWGQHHCKESGAQSDVNGVHFADFFFPLDCLVCEAHNLAQAWSMNSSLITQKHDYDTFVQKQIGIQIFQLSDNAK